VTSIGPISRSAIWRTLIVLVAAALLSACGTSRTSLPPVKVTAVPSSSINTPLLVGSCALQQCWVAGSADVQGVSSTLVERQLTSGEWTTVTAPSAAGSLTAMACSTTTCVVGGALAGQDLLWTAPTATATLRPSRGRRRHRVLVFVGDAVLGGLHESGYRDRLRNIEWRLVGADRDPIVDSSAVAGLRIVVHRLSTRQYVAVHRSRHVHRVDDNARSLHRECIELRLSPSLRGGRAARQRRRGGHRVASGSATTTHYSLRTDALYPGGVRDHHLCGRRGNHDPEPAPLGPDCRPQEGRNTPPPTAPLHVEQTTNRHGPALLRDEPRWGGYGHKGSAHN